jgi:uncharacterized protein YecA (UPF0149 family)
MDEEVIAKLIQEKDFIIPADNKRAIKRPKRNNLCPCGSKKLYSKCKCSDRDSKRTEEFMKKYEE